MYRVKPFAWIKSSAGQKDEKNDKISEIRVEKVRVFNFSKRFFEKDVQKNRLPSRKKGCVYEFPEKFLRENTCLFFLVKV